MRRQLLAIFAATLSTYALGTALAAMVVLQAVAGLGLPVTAYDRFVTVAHDLRAMLVSYLPALAAVLFPAWLLAAAVARRRPPWGALLLPLVGMLVVIALHAAARQLLGFSPLAATRETAGLALQGLAGWIGGYLCFMFLGLARR